MGRKNDAKYSQRSIRQALLLFYYLGYSDEVKGWGRPERSNNSILYKRSEALKTGPRTYSN